MGPPKARRRRVPYSEQLRRYNSFEYRWDHTLGTYYLYNPWTGETIFSTSMEILDRQKSMWAQPEKYPSQQAAVAQLLPEPYMSRLWGRRAFRGWESPEAAAIHMTAVARGFLARVWLRRYFRARYYTQVDDHSQYLYFVDRMNPSAESVWWKPRLAFPDDIRSLAKVEADDSTAGLRFPRQNFQEGPLLRVGGLNKNEIDRVDAQLFHVKNPLRDEAIRSYAGIDIDSVSLNEVIVWMDGNELRQLQLNEYHFMRTAVTTHDWDTVLHYMMQYQQNLWIQVFGFVGLGKTEVPIDNGGMIDYAAAKATELCVAVISNKDFEQYPSLLRIAALTAFYNLLSVRAGRVDYLDTSGIVEQGEFRQQAIDNHYKSKLSIFNRYDMTDASSLIIPKEATLVYNKGDDKGYYVYKAHPRAAELVECALKCLGQLAQEVEAREYMPFIVAKPALFAMEICIEEPGVIRHGLQLFYNLCYRCEPGHEAVSLCITDKDQFFSRIRNDHSGDLDVLRQIRRLELARAPDGWRGNVEEQIAQEMRQANDTSFQTQRSSNKHK